MRSSISRASASPTVSLAADEFRRRAHHVADAMTIGIAVDAAERALGVGAERRVDGSTQPARCCWSSTSVSARQACIGLAQRADAAFAQLRHQRA